MSMRYCFLSFLTNFGLKSVLLVTKIALSLWFYLEYHFSSLYIPVLSIIDSEECFLEVEIQWIYDLFCESVSFHCGIETIILQSYLNNMC